MTPSDTFGAPCSALHATDPPTAQFDRDGSVLAPCSVAAPALRGAGSPVTLCKLVKQRVVCAVAMPAIKQGSDNPRKGLVAFSSVAGRVNS